MCIRVDLRDARGEKSYDAPFFAHRYLQRRYNSDRQEDQAHLSYYVENTDIEHKRLLPCIRKRANYELLGKKVQGFRPTRSIQPLETWIHGSGKSHWKASAKSDVTPYRMIRTPRDSMALRCSLTGVKESRPRRMAAFETQIHGMKRIAPTYCVYTVRASTNITSNGVNTLRPRFKDPALVSAIGLPQIALAGTRSVILCAVARI